MCLEERIHIGLAGEVQVRTGLQYKVIETFFFQLPHNGTSNHSIMTSNKYFGV